MIDPKIISAAEAKFAVARAIIKKKAPYMAPTIYGFIPHPVEGLKTLGVSEGMVLYYDPAWIAGCSDDEVAGCYMHEAMHKVRDHIARGEGMADKSLANDAMDLAINPDIINAGWVLPHKIMPADFGLKDGLLTEEYYELLQKHGQGKQGQGKDPKGNENSSGDGPSDDDPHKERTKQCGSGRCGGIAGNPNEELEKELDQQMGRSSAECKAITKQTLHEIKSHVARFGRGSVPGSILQDIDAGLSDASKVRWQNELAHIIRKASGRIEAGGMDFSLAHPSKRSPARGFPRPGLVQHQPEVGLIIDTSGSMGTDQLVEAVKQSIAIFKGLGVDMAWLIQADAAVADKPKRIRMRDLRKSIRFLGRGGTRFDPALQILEKLKPRPDLVVYLTDGDGSASYKPKGIEIVWCIVPSPWGFGHFSELEEIGRVIIIQRDGTTKK